MSQSTCVRCHGTRRIPLRLGGAILCECACTSCNGLGYADGDACARCRGSGQEPKCTICNIPLSAQELFDSHELLPLCDHCAKLGDDHAGRHETIPPTPSGVQVANDTSDEDRDYQLAYLAATQALGCEPVSCIVDELVALTRSRRDLFDAVRAMRGAEEFDRIHSALVLLRDRRRDERWRGVTPTPQTTRAT